MLLYTYTTTIHSLPATRCKLIYNLCQPPQPPPRPTMAQNILHWLSQAGGSYDDTAIGIKDYSSEGMGMGAIALRDIPVSCICASALIPCLLLNLTPPVTQAESTLFSIPNTLLLSSSNSSLRSLIHQSDWDLLEETGGWASLMLCMMWEEVRGRESRWGGYFGELRGWVWSGGGGQVGSPRVVVMATLPSPSIQLNPQFRLL